jgi:Xaa-Pro aminopeptidase
VSELEIAAEATYVMMRKGAEHPHVYVNAGAYPRIHAEPRGDLKVAEGDTVLITLAGDYKGYYSNETRTYIMVSAPREKFGALKTIEEAYGIVKEKLRPGIALNSIELEIEHILKSRGYDDNYVQGFAHGVGLLVEEDPITTILIPHRRQIVKENMILAAIHAPLAVPGVGAIKCEDTFLIRSDRAEQLTKFACDARR